MKSKILFGIILLVVFTIGSCDLLGLGTGSVRVINSSNRTVHTLYISPSHSSSWGSNQLSYSIPPGSSRTIRSITSGSYDLRAVGTGSVTWTRFGVTIRSNSTNEWRLF